MTLTNNRNRLQFILKYIIREVQGLRFLESQDNKIVVMLVGGEGHLLGGEGRRLGYN